MRTKYIESNIEEDIDMKNQYKIKQLPNSMDPQDSSTKSYIENYSTKLGNIAHIDLNDNNSANTSFIQVNEYP